MKNEKWEMLGRASFSPADRKILEEAAKVDPAFAKQVGIALAAAGDYGVFGFTVEPATNIKVGDQIFLDVSGEVQDLLAGYPDRWQIAVAAAVIDSYGNPTSLKTVTFHPSSVKGKKYPLDNIIVIADNMLMLPRHTHLVLGAMPNNIITWAVELFASHSDTTSWDWSVWDRSAFA